MRMDELQGVRELNDRFRLFRWFRCFPNLLSLRNPWVAQNLNTVSENGCLCMEFDERNAKALFLSIFLFLL